MLFSFYFYKIESVKISNMSIEIGSIGYNHIHEKDFHMNMPNGPGAYLFLLVKSKAKFIINGKHFNVIKNSYLIIKPQTPSFYKGEKENFINDWFYFNLNEKDIEILQKRGIVFDQPVLLNNIDELSNIIHRIAFELFSSELYHSDIQSLYTQIFFYELARIIQSKDIISPDFLATKNDKLTYLRTRIFQEPAFFSSIEEMADFMNLSRSGFQHLYTKVFGHNVMQDVISARIEKSKNLLKTSSLTINEIASKCGYKTEYHFMRQFKEKNGCTPSEYRNGNTWLQIDKFRKGQEVRN